MSTPTPVDSERRPPSPLENESYPFGPGLSNLSSPSLGSRILFATDEWFATADNLLLDSSPQFVPDLYCKQGKVMDGWETRRKRTEGHDWCIINLGGGGGDIVGLEVDTAHFTGNHVPRISVEVALIEPPADDRGRDDDDGDDGWCPGSRERLERGGGVRGTGASPSFAKRAEEAVRDAGEWVEILPRTNLKPGYEETRLHAFRIDDGARRRSRRATHVRVNYYPDGGIARIRMWGIPAFGDSASAAPPAAPLSGPRPEGEIAAAEEAVKSSRGDLITLPPRLDASPSWTPRSSSPYPHPELSSSANGGVGLGCSNRHYGVPSNLIQPTYGKDMGDGWETARHPERPSVWVKDPDTGLLDSSLMDWAVLKLGMGGAGEGGVSRVIVDTRHFRGNYPESVMVEGCHVPGEDGSDVDERVCAAAPDGPNRGGDVGWFPLVPRTRVGPDAEHVYLRSGAGGEGDGRGGVLGRVVNGTRPVTHVRVRIYPDGGLSRVRIYGVAAEAGEALSVQGVPRSHL